MIQVVFIPSVLYCLFMLLYPIQKFYKVGGILIKSKVYVYKNTSSDDFTIILQKNPFYKVYKNLSYNEVLTVLIESYKYETPAIEAA